MTLSVFARAALIAAAITIAPGKAVWGQGASDRKLDKSLQQAVANGCSGGPRNVIIRVHSGYRKGMRDSLKAHGDKVHAEFTSIDGVAAEVHCDDLKALAAMSTIASISVDAPMEAHAGRPARRDNDRAARGDSKKRDILTQGEAAAKLQAPVFQSLLAWPQLRAASYLGSPATTGDSTLNSMLRTLLDMGMTGAAGGIGIGIIDSGIASGPEFENRITAFYDFTDGGVEATAPVDPYGHGTHVAALIGGVNVGVAPGSRLVGLRVLDDNGRGSTADVLRAIEFAVANKDALNLHILNLSLGHPIYESAATDPLVQAVESAVRQGLVVVVSAGNFGINNQTGVPGYAGIASPGNAPSALTIGATKILDTPTRQDDRVSAFSSRGPSWYDGFLKPDVVAPGENMLSIAAAGSRLRHMQESRGNTGEYMRLSGTSMAAGVASGVVALVMDMNPGLTPNALKAVLQYSAIPVTNGVGVVEDALTQGAGQINGGGAATLASLINTNAALGASWLKYGQFTPSTEIAGRTYSWYGGVLWGARKVTGANLLAEQRPAWALSMVWGEGLGSEDDNILWGNMFGDDDNIVWGNHFDLDDNIVWGNNLIWATDDDNIVWGNFFGAEDDNIVWGNNIVWGRNLLGIALDDDNIVWGNSLLSNLLGGLDDDNIVWGNLFAGGSVASNTDDGDNIVWGNSLRASLTGKGGKR